VCETARLWHRWFFARTKEQLARYYPGKPRGRSYGYPSADSRARHGSIQVRPILTLSEQSDVDSCNLERRCSRRRRKRCRITVRVQNGTLLVTDGPFAETKEQLAGYYITECENLDQAIEWAAKIPTA